MADRAVQANSMVFNPLSILHRASSRLKNQHEFQALCRTRLLKPSAKALSAGFPGRVVQHNAVLQRPQIEIARYAFGHVVEPDAVGPAVLVCSSLQSMRLVYAR